MAEKEKDTFLTEEGLKKLEDRLEELRSVRRLEVAERIKQAIAFGDISENSEYEDAKNEQAFIEGEIITLERMIRTAKIIDSCELSNDQIVMGSKVRLKDLESGEILDYTVVGSAEADPFESKISNESPVGMAILHRQAGETVEVQVPAGVLHYEIVEIKC